MKKQLFDSVNMVNPCIFISSYLSYNFYIHWLFLSIPQLVKIELKNSLYTYKNFKLYYTETK